MTDIRTGHRKRMLLGVIGLLVILGLGLLGIAQFWQLLLSINEEIAATIIATSGTVLVALATVTYNQRRSKERDIAEAHRDKKAAIYNEFMVMIVDVLRHTKKRDANPDLPELPDNVEGFFYEFTRESIVWASPDIIRTWERFRRAHKVEGQHVLLLIDDILREIRKDLGNSNKGLKKGDLVRLFLTDPEELDRVVEGQAG